MSRQITGINDIPTILDQNKTNGKNEFIEKEKINFSNQMDPECEEQKQPLNEEVQLNNIINLYYTQKRELDYYKKEVDKGNKDIKEILQRINKTEFETDNGLIAKMTISKRESFNEDLLLSKIHSLDIPGIIKTKEYIDMDALENAIYNGELDATELASCRIIKEVITLKVNERKDK